MGSRRGKKDLTTNIKDAESPRTPTQPKIKTREDLPSIVLQSINEFIMEMQGLKSQISDLDCKIEDKFAKLASLIHAEEPPTANLELNQQISELNDRLLRDKRDNLLKEKCNRLKHKISMTWRDTLNKRKQAYLNHLKNKSKADLYEEWLTSTPNYIPLKFRPKAIIGNNQRVAELRIAEAMSSYRTAVQTLRVYAETHQERCSFFDSLMADCIDKISESDDERNLLKERWEADVHNNEVISLQKWEKNRNFLISKKKESEESADPNNMFVTKTWDEQIAEKSSKKKTKFPKNNNVADKNRATINHSSGATTAYRPPSLRSKSPPPSLHNNNNRNYSKDYKRNDESVRANIPRPYSPRTHRNSSPRTHNRDLHTIEPFHQNERDYDIHQQSGNTTSPQFNLPPHGLSQGHHMPAGDFLYRRPMWPNLPPLHPAHMYHY